MQTEFKNLAIIGEKPDFSEGDTLTFEAEIARGSFVFFDRKNSKTIVIRLVDFEDLENFKQMIYRVDRGEAAGQIVYEQVKLEQLKAAVETKNKLDQLLAITFDNLSFFYRDNNLSDELIGKYRRGLIVREFGFTDASYKPGGLAANNRFLIATSQAKDLSAMPGGNPAHGLVVINRGSFFKVLDVKERSTHKQIVLLQIPEELTDFFDSGEELSDIEQQIVMAAREDFEKSLKEPAVQELTEKEWLDRTVSPLGMSDDGEFFSVAGAG